MAFKFIISLEGLTGLGVAPILVSRMVDSQLSVLWASRAEIMFPLLSSELGSEPKPTPMAVMAEDGRDWFKV